MRVRFRLSVIFRLLSLKPLLDTRYAQGIDFNARAGIVATELHALVLFFRE